MPTQQTIVDQIEELAAGVASDANISPLIDSEVTAYMLLPHLIRKAIMDRFEKGGNLEDVMAENLVEIGSNGYGELPDAIIRECLAMNAYLLDHDFGSYLNYPDYRRFRYDEQLAYFSNRDSKLYFSKDTMPLIRRIVAGSGNDGSNSVEYTDGLFSTADEGRRVRHTSPTAGILMDAFIQTVQDPDNVDYFAQPLFTFVETAAEFDVLSADEYVLQRSFNSAAVNTTEGQSQINISGINFTAADVGRRLRISYNSGADIAIDAIIRSVIDSAQCEMYGKALITDSGGDAEIFYSPLRIETPTIPALPSNIADNVELSPWLIKDVVILGAATLRGEIPLPALIRGYVSQAKKD